MRIFLASFRQTSWFFLLSFKINYLLNNEIILYTCEKKLINKSYSRIYDSQTTCSHVQNTKERAIHNSGKSVSLLVANEI